MTTTKTTKTSATTTTATKTSRRSVRAIAAGLACALAVAGALVAGAPSTAYAATTGTAAATQKAAAKHYNGESVTIKTCGGPVYAEWYKVNGSWVAVFGTDNGTTVHATKKGDAWQFRAVTKSGKVAIMRTQYESTKVGEVGPKGLSSHWRAKSSNVWY